MMVQPHGGGIFPLPTVQMPGPCFSPSKRVRQRASRAAAETEVTNGAARALNSMYVSLSSSSMLTRNPTSNDVVSRVYLSLPSSLWRTFNRAHCVLSGAWLPSKVIVLVMDFLLHGIRAISFPLHMLYVLMRCRLALTASPCHLS